MISKYKIGCFSIAFTLVFLIFFLIGIWNKADERDNLKSELTKIEIQKERITQEREDLKILLDRSQEANKKEMESIYFLKGKLKSFKHKSLLLEIKLKNIRQKTKKRPH